MRHRSLIALLATTLLLLSPPSQALSVVTSIKPLQLITAALLNDPAAASVLLPAGASPHDYQLRPSDLRRLQSADLVIWVGPELESFMVKPLASLGQTQRTLQLLTPAGRHAEVAAKGHAHEDGHSREHDHDHDHQGADPHIWLDPNAAIAIAKRISQRLGELDPAGAAGYREALERFSAAVRAADQRLQTRLQPLSQQGYFVFHDAYRPFEAHYGLNHRGAFSLSPERAPGARHLAEIRRQLETEQARCVFAEPQFRSAVIDSVTVGLEVDEGVLDPLGSNADSYPQLLLQLGEAFANCLGR